MDVVHKVKVLLKVDGIPVGDADMVKYEDGRIVVENAEFWNVQTHLKMLYDDKYVEIKK